MAKNKLGTHSFCPEHPVYIAGWASVAGKKESEGPLGRLFDVTSQDTKFGEQTWEQAEKKMQQLALDTLLKKGNLQKKDIDMVFSGDLLNQCIGSSFPLRGTGIPHLGLYGACSTMAQGLLLATMAVGGGYGDRAVAMTSSHFAGSERQYRFPLGYGGQRTPTAQWTVTGSGAVLLSSRKSDIAITSATIGTVTDLGITDANNMGAAMAPAAFETIRTHLQDTGTTPADYDLIVTGDLGSLGMNLLMHLCREGGIRIGGKLADCGKLIFDPVEQDVHSGGSGCGCSAVVLCSELLGKMQAGKLRRLLFCGTGALLSPTSTQQKLPIPGICHAVCIERK